MITNRFVKYLSNVLGGAIICIALSGCENFLGDVNLKQQLAEDIAYAKAKSIAILIQADEGTGTVVPAGNYTAKRGYPFEISFTEAAGYSFNGWKAVPADDAESLPENAVVFDDPNSIKTNVTVNADISNIKIVPECDDRIAIKEKSPILGNTVSRNSSIVVVFSKEPDKQSFIFSEDEIPEGAETVKNDDEEIYAYVHEGETKFKNIQITINDISIAQHYLQPQVEGKTLVINANPARLIEFDQAGSSKIISVTLSDKIFDKDNVSMNKTENWKFTINEETNEKARIELTSNAEEGAVYLAGTRDYSMGQKITLSFTENADYQFLNWQYDNNIVTVDDPYSSDTFAFVKTESNATQIKAVCAPRLRVTEVSPLSGESVSKNTPIEITFNKDLPVDDKGLLQLENISITIGGSPVRTSFKTPAVSNNIITFTADMQNMLDVPAGQTKTVTVTVPADFYYQLEDENKTKVYYGGNGKTFSYKINDTTSEKTHITFTASEGSGTITTSAAASAGYSIGQEVEISFVPADDTWQFDGWTVDVEDSKIEIKDKTALKTVLRVYEGPLTATVKAKVSKKLSAQLSGLSLESTNPKDSDIVITFNKELASNCSSMLNQIKITMDGNSVDSFFATRTLTGNKITLKNTRYLDVTGTRTKTVTVTVPASFYYVDESIAVTLTQGASFSYIVDSTSSKKLFVNFAMASSSGILTPNASSQYNLGDIVDLKFNISSGYKFTGWEYYWIDEDGNYYALVNNDEVIIDDTSAVSTKLRINQFPEDETIAGVEVYANAYLVPVVESVKLNGKIDFFSVNSCNCDSTIHITFNKEINQSSVDFSDTGSLTLTKNGNPAIHYENYFTASWKSATVLVLTPKDSVKTLVPQSSDTLNLIITFNSNKNNITDNDSHPLCPSDAVYNSLSLNYTIAGTTETTPPVITDIHMYSTNDTSDYYYRELSDTAFQSWSSSYRNLDGSVYVYGDYSQNHVSKIYIKVSGFDADSGLNQVLITETYLKDTNDNTVVKSTSSHRYGTEKIISSKTDAEGNLINTYAIAYDFDSENTLNDGLFSIDVQLVDKLGNSSTKSTYYVIKDTTNSLRINNINIQTPSPSSNDITANIIPDGNSMNVKFQTFRVYKEVFYNSCYTQRYFTLTMYEEGNDEQLIYEDDMGTADDLTEKVNTAFKNITRNVDKNVFLRLKLKEETGVTGEITIPFYKRSYIVGEKSTVIYLDEKLGVTDPTEYDSESLWLLFSTKPNPTKNDLVRYIWDDSEKDVDKLDDGIYYLFASVPTTIGGFTTYRPIDLSVPYAYYKGIEKPDNDDTITFPVITLPDTSLEADEVNYEANTGTATFTIGITDTDNVLKNSNYRYILAMEETRDSNKNVDFYSNFENITTQTGTKKKVYFLVYDNTGKQVAKSDEQEFDLTAVDNQPPSIENQGNYHYSYNDNGKYRFKYYYYRYWNETFDWPYDVNAEMEKSYDLNSIDCYIVPYSYGQSLTKSELDQSGFKKFTVSLPASYNNKNVKYLSIPYDGIDFGRYNLYFYIEDNSPLKNWSLTPSYYSLKHFVTFYVPEVSVNKDENKISIIAPSYTESLRRTNSFPYPKKQYFEYGAINGDYINIQMLEDNSWVDSVVFEFKDCFSTANNASHVAIMTELEDGNWSYKADCSDYANKFIRTTVNFTNTVNWQGSSGGNMFDIVQSQPKFIYPDYWLYKGTEDEIVCNNKNWIEGANGYQIFTDNPMFVHTLHCSRNLTELLKLEKPNATKEEIISEWESRAQETGLVSHAGTSTISFTYGSDNIKDVPTGNYYITVAYFADGTTLMSDVQQK